ncbi:MAG: hypothetical protein LBS56_02290 [Propionibacteriaceae bacterium]|jgi:hypothetical protein|nr:hypothetical protein [Propionibacteriaceae bacterium]
MSWWTFTVVGLVALAAVAGAAWTDRRNRQRREHILSDPPDRDVPGLAPGVAPDYVLPGDATGSRVGRVPRAARDDGEGAAGTTAPTEDEAGATALPERIAVATALRERIARATAIEGGWARDAFVTDEAERWAVVEQPVVLVTGAVHAFRELFPALAQARERRSGLVVVAQSFDQATLDTLVMNKVNGKLDCVAVRAPSEAALAVAAMAVGGRVVDEGSVRSGHVPPGALGTCATWVSAGAQSWALD